MNETNQIADGIILMLTGMSTVFVFLSILVFFTTIIYRLVGSPPKMKSPTQDMVDDKDTIAVITAAVHAYRKKHSTMENSDSKV